MHVKPHRHPREHELAACDTPVFFENPDVSGECEGGEECVADGDDHPD